MENAVIYKQKMTFQFFCEKCDFKCSKKSNWDTHLSTSKHKNIQNNTNSYIKNANNYDCECGRSYKHSSNYYTHRKKCNYTKLNDAECKEKDNALMNLVMEVVKSNTELQKQNQEFQKQILDVCKNGICNSNTVNSHNKTFNLHVFLNEDCKDAMNVTQFIDSFDLQLTDFENVGKLGFVNGISDIIIKKLKSLDISERPIHCTDQKRQVLYAKVIDKWEKEGDDNKILRRIIKCVAFKNSKNIQLFRDKYPDCMNWDSKHADRYQILRIESLGGLGNEDVDNENNIIRKIAREITIDKLFK